MKKIIKIPLTIFFGGVIGAGAAGVTYIMMPSKTTYTEKSGDDWFEEYGKILNDFIKAHPDNIEKIEDEIILKGELDAKGKDITIPEGITKIESFKIINGGLDDSKNIRIPKTVKTIDADSQVYLKTLETAFEKWDLPLNITNDKGWIIIAKTKFELYETTLTEFMNNYSANVRTGLNGGIILEGEIIPLYGELINIPRGVTIIKNFKVRGYQFVTQIPDTVKSIDDSSKTWLKTFETPFAKWEGTEAGEIVGGSRIDTSGIFKSEEEKLEQFKALYPANYAESNGEIILQGTLTPHDSNPIEIPEGITKIENFGVTNGNIIKKIPKTVKSIDPTSQTNLKSYVGYFDEWKNLNIWDLKGGSFVAKKIINYSSLESFKTAFPGEIKDITLPPEFRMPTDIMVNNLPNGVFADTFEKLKNVVLNKYFTVPLWAGNLSQAIVDELHLPQGYQWNAVPTGNGNTQNRGLINLDKENIFNAKYNNALVLETIGTDKNNYIGHTLKTDEASFYTDASKTVLKPEFINDFNEISSSIYMIADNVFTELTALSDDLIFPENLLIFGENVFKNVSELKFGFKMPITVSISRAHAFATLDYSKGHWVSRYGVRMSNIDHTRSRSITAYALATWTQN